MVIFRNGVQLDIPESFEKMCWKLSQDADILFPDVDIPPLRSDAEIIAYITKDLDSAERKEAKAYIESLLARNLSDRELMSIWRSAGADLIIMGDEGEVRNFFASIASALAD